MIQAHPYGPTMLRPEMFERSPKQQIPGESRGVTCCVAKCHNNTKRTPGLRWYRIPAVSTNDMLLLAVASRGGSDLGGGSGGSHGVTCCVALGLATREAANT